MVTHLFIYSSLIHDMVTLIICNVIIRLLKMTPDGWLCKRQSSVEEVIHGSEIVLAKHVVDQIIDHCQLLCYLGVLMIGPSWMFMYILAVVRSSTFPSGKIHTC